MDEASAALTDLEVDTELILARLAQMGERLGSFYHLIQIEVTLIQAPEIHGLPRSWGHSMAHLFKIHESLEWIDAQYMEVLSLFTRKIDALVYQSAELRLALHRAVDGAFLPC